MRSPYIGIVLFLSRALAALLIWSGAYAANPEAEANSKVQSVRPDSAAAPRPSTPSGRIELKRQNTERGSPEETTKTTLRLEVFLQGTVSRLRLDLPYPDEKTDFAGDPFQPRLGDIKVRTNFRPFQVWDTRLSSDIEMTFPTADSRASGGGKYQVSAAIHSVPGAPDFVLASGRHQFRFEWNVRQTVSVAGDADRKDVNNTKPELVLRDLIGDQHWLKLSFKPVIDWIQNAKTGAVLELEGGLNPSREWRVSIMGGAHLWGEGTPGNYNRRVELTVARSF